MGCVCVFLLPCILNSLTFAAPEKCSPVYGKCVKGKRYIPVKVLDVAGLVPGASTGKGLGNQFLDDLRHANVRQFLPSFL